MTCMFLSLIITINTAILVEWICIFLPDGGNQRPLFFWTCHFIIWANIVYFTVAVILANLSSPQARRLNCVYAGHGCLCRVHCAALRHRVEIHERRPDVPLANGAADGGGRGRARDSGLVRAGDAQGREWDEAEGLDGIAAIPGKAADHLARWLRRPPRKDNPDGDDKDKDDSLSWHIGSSLDSRPLPNINADGLGLGNTTNGPQHEVGGCELGPKTADERYGCLRDGHGT
ncbi:hypothetical protein MAN_07224, partial [Metarhizium hybridum]